MSPIQYPLGQQHASPPQFDQPEFNTTPQPLMEIKTNSPHHLQAVDLLQNLLSHVLMATQINKPSYQQFRCP